MVVAELEIWHSRPIAPTRRVAVGDHDLPCDPPPGYGGILLAGIVASSIGALDPDWHPELLRLTHQLEDGARVPQPRLRHRLQQDRIGLSKTRHELRDGGDALSFALQLDAATPEQMILGAVYAAGGLPDGVRHGVMRSIRVAMAWEGGLGSDFVARLSGLRSSIDLGAYAHRNPVEWALGVLGLSVPAGGTGADGADGRSGGGDGAHEPGAGADRTAVQRRFRELLREAHPDHGGDTGDAATRIAQLTEARRILLGA